MADENKSSMDSMMEIFVVETNGFLSKLEEILIENEKAEGGIKAATQEIFRIMHTIKSSSAMMSLDNISKLTHKIEDLFYYIRENPSVSVDDSKLADIVLDAVDFIKRNLDGSANEDPAAKISAADAYLSQIKQSVPAEQAPPAALVPPPQPADVNKILFVRFKKDCQMIGLRSLEVISRVRAAADELTSIPEDPTEAEEQVADSGLTLLIKSAKGEDEFKSIIMKSPFVERVDSSSDMRPAAESAGTVQPQNVGVAQPPDAAQPPERQFVERRRDSASFGKAYANVEIKKLDNLVDLVGELLIQQMELARDIEQRDFKSGESSIQKLKKLILNLQEATLSTRMIPVRETFLKMNRLVRDMCRKQEKEITFVTSGEGTEVDRSIIDNLSSPLIHIIRNSIDHGIESAEERAEQGKPETGSVELAAYTEGRNVVIAVTDDGRGFDTDRIRHKAVSGGFITETQSLSMSDDDINSLVFLPGFSTNQEVTEYSGRGVGMDVVNENMKKMNGKVVVISQKGKGTKVILKIPLTLAIIDSILIRVGEETCAIPVSFVDRIVFMEDTDSVKNVNGDDVVLMKDECYKILNLFDFYNFAERIPYADGIMIVVGGDTRKYVVFASEILDRQDVVVKPAPALFKTIRGISGCTILGDGRISLILDTDELLSALNKKRSMVV